MVEGGVPLSGEIAVSGSKNSALPALAACLLTAEPVTLNRIPQVRDIRTMLGLIRHILGSNIGSKGAEIRQEDGRVTVRAIP